MIDFEQLNKAYENDSFYSLQLEVGDKCYQGCSYCYMNAVEITNNELSDEQILHLIQEAKDLGITAIEWLGGEPLLRTNIFNFMKKAKELGFRNNMWTGGLPFSDKSIIKKTADSCIKGLISVHLSSINHEIYKTLHPNRSPDDINIIINGLKYLLDIGYPSDQILNSVTFTGLQSANDMIETIQYFDEVFGIQTSLNIYHTYLRPGYTKNDLLQFIPDLNEVAKVYSSYKSMLGATQMPMNCVNKQYCSTTLAVLNNGYVTPCATIREEKDGYNLKHDSLTNIVEHNREYLIFKYLKDKDNLPEKCKKCRMNNNCWGCRSRSFAIGNGIYGEDPRCFRNISRGSAKYIA